MVIVGTDGNKITAAKAFANWYYNTGEDDGAVQECTYPCNPTCY